jgi:hypothetical protein
MAEEPVVHKTSGLMTPELDVTLADALRSPPMRALLAEMLRTMHFLESLDGADKEKSTRLLHTQETALIWYERMYMVSKRNTALLLQEHFMEGGEG